RKRIVITLDRCLKKTKEDIKLVESHKVEAEKKPKTPEFVDDIDDELQKLKKRKTIYEEMQELRKKANGQMPTTDQRLEWNLDYEWRRYKHMEEDHIPASADSDNEYQEHYFDSEEEDEFSEEESDDEFFPVSHKLDRTHTHGRAHIYGRAHVHGRHREFGEASSESDDSDFAREVI
ncbi:hypothetical protein PMAYCL1PPCAC_10889, partial [Pristionchus mayeri]